MTDVLRAHSLGFLRACMLTRPLDRTQLISNAAVLRTGGQAQRKGGTPPNLRINLDLTSGKSRPLTKESQAHVSTASRLDLAEIEPWTFISDGGHERAVFDRE